MRAGIGNHLHMDVLTFPLTSNILKPTTSFSTGLRAQHGRAHTALCRPELILQGQLLASPRAPPTNSNPSILLPDSFTAQVYNDISHGGVFEDGCVQRHHVFPSIHDAVLFAQANAREAPASNFQGVRSSHLKNPRFQLSQTGGQTDIRKNWRWFKFQHQFCHLVLLNLGPLSIEWHCQPLPATLGLFLLMIK